MLACSGLGTDTTLRFACEDAHGLRAGALITASGGLSAGRRPIVATTREVPYAVAPEGGFPSLEEFTGVWTALANVLEFGVDRLFVRINGPLVDSFESDGDLTVAYTYEDIGVLAARSAYMADVGEELTSAISQLQDLVTDIADAIGEGGRVASAPRFDRYGRVEYEVAQRWIESAR